MKPKLKPKRKELPVPEPALPAMQWLPILDAAGLTPPTLGDAKTPHARAIKLGQWLSAKVGREIPVCFRDRNGKAVLRVIGVRANEKRYYFEITWDDPTPARGATAEPEKKRKTGDEGKRKKPLPHTPSQKGEHKRRDVGNDEEW